MSEGNMFTIKSALEWATSYLGKRKIDSPRLTAELLLIYVLGKSRLDLYLEFDRPVDADVFALFKKLILSRSSGVPLSYLTGEQEFMGLKFKVTSDVYIPRPETEILVEETLKEIQCLKLTSSSPFVILDLGTGCGNIAISLVKKIENSKAYATDVSRKALKVAMENARIHSVENKVTFLEGDLFSPLNGLNLEGRVDLIISNPPYVAASDMDKLPAEVKNEPRIALEGGEDGLSFYRRIIYKAPKFLRKGGILSMEIGYNQAEAVKEIIINEGELEIPRIIKDYAGKQRVILTKRSNRSEV